MNPLYTIAISGFAATIAMSLFLSFLHRANIANTDMVRAIGSVFTRSESYAFRTGIIIHMISGIFFAYLYSIVLAFAPLSTDIAIIMVSTTLSFFHGLVMTMLLAIVVAEHHPLARFQKAGIDVLFGHLVAHVVYGFTLGVMLTSLKFDPSFFGIG